MPTLSLEPLTTKQEDLLVLIERSQLNGDPTPTYQELVDKSGLLSRGSIVGTVKQIYRKGYLEQVHAPGEKGRGFSVVVPVLAPRYIGLLDLSDRSLSLGYPKHIPHCKSWERCVAIELGQDDPVRNRMEGDILILKPTQGYHGQALNRLEWWGNYPEQMVFDRTPKASFDVVGVWRSYD